MSQASRFSVVSRGTRSRGSGERVASARERMEQGYSDLSKMIDHALLSPALDTRALEAGLDLAIAYGVASVCVVPYYLERAAERLRGSGVKASTTIGFPQGGHATAVKVYEAERALRDGGEELDMVVNVSRVVSSDWDYVRGEIAAVLAVTRAAGRRLKVIFENAYLDDRQKVRLCEIAGELRVDWVKTSTGFAESGATLADVRLMRQHSPAEVEVKASGGVRDLDALLALRPYITRCGTSRTQEILDEWRSRLGLPPLERGATRP